MTTDIIRRLDILARQYRVAIARGDLLAAILLRSRIAVMLRQIALTIR
jgi:hypothetical protein